MVFYAVVFTTEWYLKYGVVFNIQLFLLWYWLFTSILYNYVVVFLGSMLCWLCPLQSQRVTDDPLSDDFVI